MVFVAIENFKKFKLLPYDYACPSQQTILTRRCCSECGLYHASLKSLKQHNLGSHKRMTAVERCRPVRIAARRQRELMCVLKRNLLDEDEEIEWLSEDEVDSSGVHWVPNNPNVYSKMPVIDNLEGWVSSPWDASEGI
jgi:hypothetical protein